MKTLGLEQAFGLGEFDVLQSRERIEKTTDIPFEYDEFFSAELLHGIVALFTKLLQS